MLEHKNKSNNDMYPNTISKKLVSVPDDILEEEKLFKTMNVFANFCYAKDITDEEECEIFDESLLNCVRTLSRSSRASCSTFLVSYVLPWFTYLVLRALVLTCFVLHVSRALYCLMPRGLWVLFPTHSIVSYLAYSMTYYHLLCSWVSKLHAPIFLFICYLLF